MTYRKRKEQRGIALFQVLLIVAITSVLLLVIAGYSQNAVEKALLTNSRLQAKLVSYSNWSELQFELLTKNWTEGEDILTDVAVGVNFYGDPFEFSGQQARLQSQNSLLYIGSDGRLMRHLLEQLGYDEMQINRKVDALLDWIDSDDERRLFGAEQRNYREDSELPANLPIQTLTDLELVSGWNKDDVEKVTPFITLYPNGILNPAFMPIELMRYYVSAGESSIVQQRREANDYDSAAFTRITGISADEFLSLMPSDRLSFYIGEDSATINTYLSGVVEIRPYNNNPIVLREFKWR